MVEQSLAPAGAGSQREHSPARPGGCCGPGPGTARWRRGDPDREWRPMTGEPMLECRGLRRRYGDLTAVDGVGFQISPGETYGLLGPNGAGKTTTISMVAGLLDRAGDQTKKYSGGMKRRLNVGIGLLHRPKLLILDEPTVGVDPQSRNAILESVEGLSGEGMAVLYTTHYMEEAERLCDRVGIIDRGKLIAEGTRNELVSLVGEGDRVRLLATGNLAKAAAELAGQPWVRQAGATDQGIDVVVEDARSHLPEVLTSAAAAGTAVRSVEVTEPDLEAVFLHLTGRALRD